LLTYLLTIGRSDDNVVRYSDKNSDENSEWLYNRALTFSNFDEIFKLRTKFFELHNYEIINCTECVTVSQNALIGNGSPRINLSDADIPTMTDGVGALLW